MPALHLLRPGYRASRILLLACSYAVVGHLCLSHPFAGTHISLIWAPAGLALAGLLRWGQWLWPGVWLGALLINYLAGLPLWIAAGIASGNTLVPWLIVRLLRHYGIHSSLDRRQDLLAFLFIGVVLGASLSALNGASQIWLAGKLPPGLWLSGWLYWWLGDAIGTLIVGTPLLTFSWRRLIPSLRGWRLPETVTVLSLLLLLAVLLFLSDSREAILLTASPLLFIPFLLLSWIAIRAGVGLASLAALAVSVIAALGTLEGQGGFSLGNPHQNLLMLWSYMATMSVITMLITVLLNELTASRQHLELAINGANQGTWDWDLQQDRLEVHLPWRHAGNERLASGDLHRLVHPDDKPLLDEALTRHLAGESASFHCELRLRCRSRQWRWVMARGSLTGRDDRLKPLRMVGMVADISARKRDEERLRLSASVFAHAREAIMITDERFRILDTNDAFTELTGYARGEVLGRVPGSLRPGTEAAYEPVWRQLRNKGYWRGEINGCRKDGTNYTEHLTVSAVLSPAGTPGHYVAMSSDVTLLKQQQQALEYQAHYDSLTGLPNRTLLSRRMTSAMAATRRRQLAICYLDLDGFKPINDQFGHDGGDKLLVMVAERLGQHLGPDDTLARLGGDEFILLLDHIGQRSWQASVDRVLQLLNQPYPLEERQVRLSASIGVVIYPEDGEDVDGLIRRADQAMYRAKQAGRNRCCRFDDEHDSHARARQQMQAEMEQALAERRLLLYFQPKIDMRSGALIGAEALLRWQHADGRLLTPPHFLPQIEATPLDLQLGNWVLAQAVAQLRDWQRRGHGLSLSVNISPHQLQDPGFIPVLERLLAEGEAIAAGRLELEILETAAIKNIKQVTDIIHHCHRLGLRIALDDFGTGYSSLTYLKRLPADVLKIDKSFVIDMLDNPEDKAIVQGIIGLARAFQREVVAEGVESAGHRAMLLGLDCHLGQGFGIARPMPAAEFERWQQQYRPRPCRPEPIRCQPPALSPSLG
ncbi:GGDEF domain-containing protein [Zobellella endophytica]|uniref:GGDEF domain-containing protein n=1 Tax=Zobellella endophytica TaxID=2116700 RepID=A0A2P7R8P7_9GAMM|nr:EAL domain-containing protein [Zobellella endophytica]PSJ46563.1 GGDEF domain-containing protein [Zobellella endophytica]